VGRRKQSPNLSDKLIEMMQNYGSTVKLLSDLELLNEVFTCAFVFLSFFKAVAQLDISLCISAVGDTTLKQEMKRIKRREKEKKARETKTKRTQLWNSY
jgi:hypothetical protein